MIHYLKKKYRDVNGKNAFHSWCGLDATIPGEVPPPRPYQFTYNISNVECEDCKEAAALEELSKVP